MLRDEIHHNLQFPTREFPRTVRNARILFEPRARNKFGRKQITVFGPKCYNNLSESVKEISTTPAFIKAMKKEFSLPSCIQCFLDFRSPYEWPNSSNCANQHLIYIFHQTSNDLHELFRNSSTIIENTIVIAYFTFFFSCLHFRSARSKLFRFIYSILFLLFIVTHTHFSRLSPSRALSAGAFKKWTNYFLD